MNTENQDIIIIKLDPQGQETWRYPGQVINSTPNSILIEAYFNREDLLFHGITLRKNDRFIERYFTNHWYNIFQIHDREDDQVKGWYCNITTPAQIRPGEISYVDLALDLLVYPDGNYLVLDEDEFKDLDIDDEMQKKALDAKDELIEVVITRGLPDFMKPDFKEPE